MKFGDFILQIEDCRFLYVIHIRQFSVSVHELIDLSVFSVHLAQQLVVFTLQLDLLLFVLPKFTIQLFTRVLLVLHSKFKSSYFLLLLIKLKLKFPVFNLLITVLLLILYHLLIALFLIPLIMRNFILQLGV